MKKIIFLSLFVALFTTKIHAQVKISDAGVTTETPAAGALLELETTTKGLLMPRVALTATNSIAPFNNVANNPAVTTMSQLAGMTVYNTTDNGIGATRVTKGYYYNDGEKWVKIGEYSRPQWFYMPSIDIPVSYTSDADRTKTVYLYDEYIRQFKKMTTNVNGTGVSNMVSSDNTNYPDVFSALPGETTLLGKTDIIYFVVDYDENLFDFLSITNEGVLTYQIKSGAVATDQSYMNIVFVRK